MRSKLSRAAAAALLVLAALPAQAALIDQGVTTLDDATGLEWLDLTETLGLSANDFLGGAGGFLAAGWGLADVEQVQGLLGNLFDPFPNDTGNVPAGNPANQLPAVDAALGLFGETSDPGSDAPYGEGWALDTFGNPGTVCQPFYQKIVSSGASRVGAFCNGASSSTVFSELGVWAVRPADVPEPATIALLALGGAALARRGRALRG